MAAFPSSLPSPVTTGYGFEQQQAFVRTNMEVGAARQRKRFTATTATISTTWRFKQSEMTTFLTFWNVTINKGTDWFIINLDLGSGITNVNARATSKLKTSRLPGANWEVSLMLEVLNG